MSSLSTDFTWMENHELFFYLHQHSHQSSRCSQSDTATHASMHARAHAPPPVMMMHTAAGCPEEAAAARACAGSLRTHKDRSRVDRSLLASSGIKSWDHQASCQSLANRSIPPPASRLCQGQFGGPRQARLTEDSGWI